MFKLRIGLLVLSVSLIALSKNTGFCNNSVNKVNTTFLKALAQVESSNNPRAYNVSERAIGIYQIRKLYFIDALKFNPQLKKYKHKDCYRPAVARLVVTSYLTKYAPSGKYEDMARCHNGGLNWKKATGQKKKNLDKYWLKIKKELSKQSN